MLADVQSIADPTSTVDDAAPSAGSKAPRAREEGHADRQALAADVYALVSHMMRSSHVGALDTIVELDLSLTQIKTLYAMELAEEEPCLKVLAKVMGVSLATMSRTVDGLFERGFLDRAEDPDDRRMKRIRLTADGRAVTSALNRSRLRGIEEFVKGISDQEADALAGALAPLIASRPEIAEHRPRKGVSR